MNKFAVSFAPQPGGYPEGGAGELGASGIAFRADKQPAAGNVILDKLANFAEAVGGRPIDASGRGDSHYRAMLEALPVPVYATDHDGRITFFNDAAAEFWGVDPTIGESRWCGSWRLRNAAGTLLPHDESPLALAIKTGCVTPGMEAAAERPDGTLHPFTAFPTLLRDSQGTVCGAVNMLVDISERKQAELHQKTLVDELNHRVKNMLATVQSLAIQTIRSAGVGRDVLRSFDSRLFALGRVHDLLTLGQWQSADLKSVVSAVLKPFESPTGSRILCNGGTVRLAPREAVLLAMVLHELASNASQYGALSSRDGTLSVVWRETVGDAGGRSLCIEWQEANGPEVVKPTRHGFGTKLIERGIASELKGSASVSYNARGVHCSISIPLAFAEQ